MSMGHIFEANTQMVVLKGGHCCMPPFYYLLSHAVKWRNKLHFLVIAIFTATKRPRGRLLQSVSGLYPTLFAKFSMFHIFTLLFVKNCLEELRSEGVLTIALVQISCTDRTSLLIIRSYINLINKRFLFSSYFLVACNFQDGKSQ